MARLADPVRAIDRLRLHGRIPPRIEKEDILGRRQVQAQASGLEADQEQPGTLDRSWKRATGIARSRVCPSRYS